MAIFRREPPNGGVKCRWSRQKRDSWLWHLRLVSVINSFDCGANCITAETEDDRHASVNVNLVYDSNRRRRFFALDRYGTPKRRQQNLIICGKCKAELIIKTALKVLYCWMYLATDTMHRADSLRQQNVFFTFFSHQLCIKYNLLPFSDEDLFFN